MEDWWSVTEQGRRVTLPRAPSVRAVLEAYAESKTAAAGGAASADGAAVAEVVNGLCAYFDRALHAILLYRHERPQVRGPGAPGRLRRMAIAALPFKSILILAPPPTPHPTPAAAAH